MPEDAPKNKRAATLGYGAEIITCAPLHRDDVTAQLIADKGYTLIHPFDNDNIIAGQGTAALELFDEVGELDYLFVPVGGGIDQRERVSSPASITQLSHHRRRASGSE